MKGMELSACFMCKEHMVDNENLSLKGNNTQHTETNLVSFIHTVSGLFYDDGDVFICRGCLVYVDDLDYAQKRCQELKEQLLGYLERNYTPRNFVEYACDYCECKFISDSELGIHISEKHLQINESVTAGCDKTVDINDGERDEVIVGGNADSLLQFKCNQCRKNLATTSELKLHILTSHSGQPFICEICGQAYKQRSAFDVHVGMHKGIHPFTCIYCKKSFTQKIALQRHMRMHTGENPYQCEFCGKTFTHHTSFNTHTMSHTKQKDYKCSKCNLAFMTSSHLKRHTRVHTGEKNFECTACGKKFAERYNLATHQKLHELNTNAKQK